MVLVSNRYHNPWVASSSLAPATYRTTTYASAACSPDITLPRADLLETVLNDPTFGRLRETYIFQVHLGLTEPLLVEGVELLDSKF